EGSPAKELKVMEMKNNGAEAGKMQREAETRRHRSLYLPLLRLLTPRALEGFDFAEQGLVTGSRGTTTVAPQALYMLNDPFVRKQALGLAERVLRTADKDDAQRIQSAYRLTLGRNATSAELERVRNYLADYEAAKRTAGGSKPATSGE